MAEIENLSAGSDGQTQKVQDIHAQKLKSLEVQVTKVLAEIVLLIGLKKRADDDFI